jgi:zinc transporter, ZIP family
LTDETMRPHDEMLRAAELELPPSRRLATWVPVLLLVLVSAGLVALLLTAEDGLLGGSPVPPEALLKIEFERIAFGPGEVIATVRNTGPREVTIAQVTVNDALWHFVVTPGPTLARMQRARVAIPYLWEAGDPVEVKLITSTGLVFKQKVDIAVETLRPSLTTLGRLALLGIYVGVIPVYLGFLCVPVLRRLGERWLRFLLSLTAGLLLFLGVDAFKEALEAVGRIPSVFRGVGILLIGVSAGLLGLRAVAARTRTRGDAAKSQRLALAYLIAASIGLHNLGEGLAIGAAYALGEAALGRFLIVGFTVHNTTEGFAVIAPLARNRVGLGHLLALGVLAGAPTILGTWIGGLAESVVWSVLFLALGVGAIGQVLYELRKLTVRDVGEIAGNLTNILGLILGLVVMYLAGLLVQL